MLPLVEAQLDEGGVLKGAPHTEGTALPWRVPLEEGGP